MKTTTKTFLVAALFTVGMLAFSSKASATNLTFGDSNEVGTVAPDVPQGDADRVEYVNDMIGLGLGAFNTVTIHHHVDTVTRTFNVFGSLPAVSTASLHDGPAITTINLNTLGTFSYLFAHYGGPGGGTSFVWDIASFTGVITIPANYLAYGLSGWSLMNQLGGPTTVPDGGATIMLLGLGLSALGMVRRFLKS